VGLVPTGHRTRRCHGAVSAERLMCESWVLPRQNSLKRKLVTGDNWVQQSISHSSTLPRGPGGVGQGPRLKHSRKVGASSVSFSQCLLLMDRAHKCAQPSTSSLRSLPRWSSTSGLRGDPAPQKVPFPNPHAETRTELRSGSTCGASANGSSVIIRVIASRCLRRINVDQYWDIAAAAAILRNYFQISVNGEQARS
jgi:hypothetical protein